jgi:hypothetical protein
MFIGQSQEFSESCATFVHVIEQLTVQVCTVEAHAGKDGPSESKVLNRIAQQVCGM